VPIYKKNKTLRKRIKKERRMRPVYIEAVTLPDAWFQTLEAILKYGRKYRIDQGSYEKDWRLELDHLTMRIKRPHDLPMIPEIPPGLGFPAPTTMTYVEEYLGYLMEDAPLKENESYSYGRRIKSQMEQIIRWYSGGNFGSNQMTISVSQPSDIFLEDPPCFSEGSVITKDGIVDISEIEVGQEVLTHKGRFRPVNQVFKRHYNGDLRKIVTRGNARGLTCTPGHKLLAVRTVQCPYDNKLMCKPCCGKKISCYDNKCKVSYDEYKSEWISTEDLSKFTYLATPRRIDTENYECEFSEKELFLFGIFLADGCCNGNGITFCIGDTKKTLQQKIIEYMKEVYGLEVHIGKYPGCSQLKFYSVKLCKKYEEMFNRGALKKKVPASFFRLSEKDLNIVLQGWVAGDGYIRKKETGNRITLSTSSKKLMRFAEFALNRLGYASSITGTKPKDSSINGRIIKSNGLNYIICWHVDPKQKIYWSDDQNIYIPVKSNICIPFSGDVYNLEVDEDNSYNINSIYVKNCLRSIDFRIFPKEALHQGETQALHFYINWRSNCAFNGLPSNLAALALMQQYMSECIGVEPGELVYTSKGTHIYGPMVPFAKLRVGVK
jgi:hypothetical protein